MWLVSAGTDLKFHNTVSYDPVHVYRPADSSGQIRNVSWCKDGSWLALVPNRGNAEIIRTKDDVRLLQTILGVPQPTATVFQRTTKRNVAMSTVSGSVLIYDIKAKSVKKRFVNTGSSVTMLDWSLKDTHLVAGGTDGQITLYSNTTNQKSSVFTVPESKSVSVVRFHSTERPILGTASDEGVVAVWDINNGRQKMCLKTHKAPVTDLTFSSQNSQLMISVGLDRTFQCYDIHAGVVALTVMTDHPLSAIDMSPEGYIVALGSSRGTIYIYDLRQHETPLKTIVAHSGEIKKILYQPNPLDSTTDSVQISEEKPVEHKSSTASVDSFSNMLSNVSEFSSKSTNGNVEVMEEDLELKIKNGSAAGDSFLNGFENFDSLKRITDSFVREKSELSNLGLSDSVKKWLDTRKSQSTSNEKLSDIPIPSFKITSTPGLPSRVSSLKIDESSNISPIVQPQSITAEEINKIINNSVNEAVSSAVKDVVTSVVKEEISDLSDSFSRFFLNLQLSFSKQFVGQETHMERLFSYYCGAAANSNLTAQVQQLQEENEFLKQKINELLRNKNP